MRFGCEAMAYRERCAYTAMPPLPCTLFCLSGGGSANDLGSVFLVAAAVALRCPFSTCRCCCAAVRWLVDFSQKTREGARLQSGRGGVRQHREGDRAAGGGDLRRLAAPSEDRLEGKEKDG